MTVPLFLYPHQEDKIKSLYLAELFSSHKIAEIMGISQSSVIKVLKKLGVPLRRRGGSEGGELSPNWQGLYSKPYVLSLAKVILVNAKVDLFKCMRCQTTTSQAQYQIHHKDRKRQNNTLDNLEVLCITCHIDEHRFGRIRRVRHG